MVKKESVTFRTKLGAAKKVPRSRIWIEGKRLVDAGFTVGRYFAKEWTLDPHPKAGAASTLVLTLLKDNDVTTTMPCKVSGKGTKPIIDITGESVASTFALHGTHVEVQFSKGKIVIRPAGDEGTMKIYPV